MGIRTTQTIAEALTTPSTQRVRATQTVVEAPILPDNRRIRTSSLAVEALIKESTLPKRAYAQVIG